VQTLSEVRIRSAPRYQVDVSAQPSITKKKHFVHAKFAKELMLIKDIYLVIVIAFALLTFLARGCFFSGSLSLLRQSRKFNVPKWTTRKPNSKDKVICL
jgi:hypothetical protein